jgi:hypothetical protein|tara:strand:+ start:9111 stop:10220 length:1110 start_codon:yes stop_codon:yes gene_type:complete
MPSTYEVLDVNTDSTTTKTILHEVLPLTGTLASGTYDSPDGTSFNIKNYTHGMFQSVFDYPFLSSSANHIYDITFAYDESSPLSSSASVQNSKKINIYNQFTQLLFGFTGSANRVRRFESDLELDGTGQMKEVVIIPFSRLITKDQIKKGTFSIELGTGSFASPFTTPGGSRLLLQDASASANGGTTPTIGGDYGVLYANNGDGTFGNGYTSGSGVVFYQAGIAVVTASVFSKAAGNPLDKTPITDFGTGSTGGMETIDALMTGSAISASCDAFRHRIYNISFNNSTEINSTIYFCRLPVNKFNYSSNPTYTRNSKIQVKNEASDLPVSYVTTVGLYNARNELLAVAKLSEPLKKTPQNELTLRVRLDY